MKPLTKTFFEKPTCEVAKNLLGCYISFNGMLGKIVETESYLFDDPASHSFCGKTPRNSPMFEQAGKSYVYFTYGMYHCFNITTAKKEIGEAVLIRSVEPIKGIEKMKQNRKTDVVKNLTNGPAKFTTAFGITKSQNNINILTKTSPIKLYQPNKKEKFEIIQTTRIGIKKGTALPHRFYIKDNPFVSKK